MTIVKKLRYMYVTHSVPEQSIMYIAINCNLDNINMLIYALLLFNHTNYLYCVCLPSDDVWEDSIGRTPTN